MTASPRRRWTRHLIGLAITALCLVVFLRQVDGPQVLHAMANYRWSYLVPGILCLAVGFGIRIWRWSFLLRAAGSRSTPAQCVAPFLGSIALNNVLPLRLGDVVRAFVFPRAMGVPSSVAAGSLVLERLIDMVVVIAFFAVGLLALQSATVPVQMKAVAATFGIVAITAMVLSILFGAPLARLLDRIARSHALAHRTRLVELLHAGASFLRGIAAMSRASTLARIAVPTLLIWVLESLLYFSALRGVGVAASPIVCLFVMSLATLSTAIPSSPGYVGPFHVAAYAATSLAGGTPAQAATYAVIVHLAVWVPTTVAGALALWLRPGLFKAARSAQGLEPSA